MEGAKGVLFNIVGGPDMSMNEVSEAAHIIGQAADPDANIIFGATIKEDMVDMVKISVIATGFDETRERLREYAGIGRFGGASPFGGGGGSFGGGSSNSGGGNPAPAYTQPSYQQPQPSTPAQNTSGMYRRPEEPIREQHASQQSEVDDEPFNDMGPDEPEDDLDIPAFLRQNR